MLIINYKLYLKGLSLVLSLIDSNGLDHPSVQRVIKIAEEIVEQNRPLTTEIV